VRKPSVAETAFDIAARVILEEAEALKVLASNIPSNFEEAVAQIYQARGRLIVTGIGKSGHIGTKIASTMASTGQKSFFLHPSEAHHGDLGMIDSSDVLLFISYSGETTELSQVIDYSKRIGATTISITKSIDSTIAKNTDLPLILPDVREACPIGMAPTVSSTLTLALGDALAIALLTQRGFTKAQFKMLHPGGSLSKRLVFVSEIMHTGAMMPLAPMEAPMQNLIQAISDYGFGCIGLVDSTGSLIGMITDGDLRRNIKDDLLHLHAAEIMTKNPIIEERNILVSEMIRIMETNKITSMFIVNKERKPIGYVHLHDILKTRLEI
jgi:arabinose-5-phosphate isomerase